jgi:UDP-N-acetylmuramoyl-L-alanyl-D-glutamate--2,6-diaminopimelate ligase
VEFYCSGGKKDNIMKLLEILEKLDYQVLREGAAGLETEITGIVLDSRKAEPGCLFTCIKGAVVDGHKFAADVAKAGAAAIIVEDEISLPETGTAADAATAAAAGPVIVKVPDSRYALACMSAAWFGHPAEKLTTIGITGTKGKTTTTYMVKAILENIGHKVGLIGTIEADTGARIIPTANTTPESYTVQQYFREMADAGCDALGLGRQAMLACADMTAWRELNWPERYPPLEWIFDIRVEREA